MHMKNIVLLALALSSLTLSAQTNSQQAAAYLGQFRFTKTCPPAGKVVFDFSVVPIERTANGKQTYSELLKKGQFMEQGQYGTLTGVFVTEAGQLVQVPRYKPATDPTGTLTRADVPAGGMSFVLPDSVSISAALDKAREGVDKTAKTIGPAIGEIWAFWIWMFNSYLLPILITAGSFFLLIAKVSAAESLVSRLGIVAGRFFVQMHQWSSAGLAVILCVIALTFLASIDLWLWKTTGSNLVLAVGAVFSVWIEYAIICRVIPNLQVSGHRSGDKYAGASNLTLPRG